MIRVFVLLLAAAFPANAQSARVFSGEHDEFTRVVIELPGSTGWVVGRTDTGYAFAVSTQQQPDYDLSTVWQKIGRNRLASIVVQPESGALDLKLSCLCHILPFEYSPGVIVLDVKPGPAPDASAFEAKFHGTKPETERESRMPTKASYDWLALDRDVPQGSGQPALPLPLATGGVSLDPFRDELLKQISRGAAEGVVDMALPGKPKEPAVTEHGDLPWTQIRIGEMPGIEASVPNPDRADHAPDKACAPDALLDLPSWGGDSSAIDLLAKARSGLFGEFDKVDPDVVLESVRALLYLGFGAEAEQHLDFVDVDFSAPELALYRSIARVLDDGADPKSVFSTMLDCDGAAALWAALARESLPSPREIARDSILRNFMALPSHARQNLGGGLAEKFLALGDTEAARIIRDAVDRAPTSDEASIALLDAKSDLQAGKHEAAREHAEAALSLAGDRTESLITLVEVHSQTAEPLGAEIVTDLQSIRGEAKPGPVSSAIDRAIVLGLVLSGKTDAAFVEASSVKGVEPDLWKIAVVRAIDDDFLRHAVLPETAVRPDVAPLVALAIAERLLSFGFADAALKWLGPVDTAGPDDYRLVAASAELESGDARSALGLLDGLSGAEVEALRSKALVQLGDFAAASRALSDVGEIEEGTRMSIWQNDWAELEDTVPEPWLVVAAHLKGESGAETAGLLAQGTRTAELSTNARADVETLLSTIPSPSDD